MDPLTHGKGPGSELRVPVGPPYGPLPARTEPFSRWIRLFSETCKFLKFDFFRDSSDDLVTIRVLEHQ